MSLGHGQPGHDAGASVAVTGVGAVCGYGWGEKRLREGLFGARSAVRLVAGLPGHRDPAWLSLVDDDGVGDALPERASRFVVGEALADAHDRGWRPGARTGLVQAGRSPDSKTTVRLMDEFELSGPYLALAGEATSGPLGLLTAQCWIDDGLADDVIVLCSELSAADRVRGETGEPGLVVGRSAPSACRPFQQDSVGANPGEAAVAMVVSRTSPTAYAQLRGGAFAHSRTAAEAMHALLRHTFDAALTEAATAVGDVAYVNAHGAGVPELDAAEAKVIDELFGSAIALYSVKPLVGDCGVASGAVELLAALYGFSTGVVPAPARMAPGHARLLDGPTASVEGMVAKTSIDDTGSCAVVVLGTAIR